MKKGVNKKAKKHHVSHKKTTTAHHETAHTNNVEQTLVSNFVALQKVFTNIAVKFDNLSGQISKLLDLFEISAKSMAEKNLDVVEKSNDEEILKKINNLIEQNKIIAKGVSMLHEPEEIENPIAIQKEFPQVPRPSQEQNFQSPANPEKRFKQLPGY